MSRNTAKAIHKPITIAAIDCILILDEALDEYSPIISSVLNLDSSSSFPEKSGDGVMAGNLTPDTEIDPKVVVAVRVAVGSGVTVNVWVLVADTEVAVRVALNRSVGVNVAVGLGEATGV